MKNLISERVADFLKNYPPFNIMETKLLEEISQQVSIIYKEKGSLIFSFEEEAHPYFYVVHKGAIELTNPNLKSITDYCDEGDIFGLRPLIAKENYKLEARAFEESILYAIPIAVFRPISESNQRVSNFLTESFASNTRNPYNQTRKLEKSGISTTLNAQGSLVIDDFQPIRYSKKLVSCEPKTTIQKAAAIMTKYRIGSVLICKNELPIGIVTDKDLRNKVVTGDFPITSSVRNIMSSPVITYPEKITIAQAQMAMMKNGISHLILTKDGTTNSEPVGIISKNDIMVSLGDNPSVIVKAIKRAKKIKQVKELRKSIMMLLNGYLEQNLPMALTSKIISELNDTCIKQVIAISLERMKVPPPVNFAWLALGSQGRGEQLLHTDQDNALVFEDVPEEELSSTTNYFLEFSKKVNKGLNKIGYEYCPADMMASNPKWCLSLKEWKNKISYWIINPGPNEVLMSSIFFDYSMAYGHRDLMNEISDFIFSSVKKIPDFLGPYRERGLAKSFPFRFLSVVFSGTGWTAQGFFRLKKQGIETPYRCRPGTHTFTLHKGNKQYLGAL